MPTGSVQFFDGATTIGTGPVNSSGQAVLTLSGASTLNACSHSITAAYGGDSDNTTATSSALAYVVSKAQATLATSLTSAPNPSTYGDAVTFTVSVASSAGAIPTGTVNLSDGATSLGTVALSSGTASFTTSQLSAGSHTITATYSGDGNYD